MKKQTINLNAHKNRQLLARRQRAAERHQTPNAKPQTPNRTGGAS